MIARLRLMWRRFWLDRAQVLLERNGYSIMKPGQPGYTLHLGNASCWHVDTEKGGATTLFLKMAGKERWRSRRQYSEEI